VIGVVNYQTGNAQSVLFALHHLGLPARLVATPDEAEGGGEVDRFILPGVGAADVTMASLRERGWVEYLDRRVRGDGVPFLGVCVGLQVLFDHSAEGDVDCLGWLPGTVVRFEGRSGRRPLRVPHMGWNVVRPTANRPEHPFARSLPPAANFYFVNSFHAVPAQESDVAGDTDYGVRFASVVARGNVMATQFHIEKSGPVGLALLASFARLERSALAQVPSC
jgi:glutamine amidotransferase